MTSSLTRRGFGLALAAATQVAAESRRAVELGVQSFSFKDFSFQRMLEACRQAGLDSIELWSGHIEPPREQRQGPDGAAKLRDWRISEGESVCREAVAEISRLGLRINAFNLTLRNSASDDEIDAAFRMTKALGVDILTSSSNVSTAGRIEPFAASNRVRVGFHNHARIKEDEFATPEDFEQAMRGRSEYLGVNLDVGHFYAAGFDNVAFLQRHAERIFTLHMKDRKSNDGDKVPFGQGETPLGEILRLVRDRGWKIPANIEMAYPTDDPVREVRESLEFMKRELDRA